MKATIFEHNNFKIFWAIDGSIKMSKEPNNDELYAFISSFINLQINNTKYSKACDIIENLLIGTDIEDYLSQYVIDDFNKFKEIIKTLD